LEDGSLIIGFFLLHKGGLEVKTAIVKEDIEWLPRLGQIDSSDVLRWCFQLRLALSLETMGINRFPATTASSPATSLLLGNHFLLGRAGYVIYIPCHLIFIPAGVNNFLLSGRLGVGAAKGMSKMCGSKRFELIRERS
jgi:hypothetical protein